MARSVTARPPVSDRYLALIKTFPLRRITTAADHSSATRLVVQFSTATDRGTREYVDVLVDLIVDYEKRAGWAIDTSDVTAADLIQHLMAEREMTVTALAKLVGIPQSNLSQMLSGKRAWSKSAIRALSAQFKIPAERFLT